MKPKTISPVFSSSFIILALLSTIGSSKSIIKNLPGFPGDLPFTFETGYVGVGKDEQVQFFYYFVESERNPQQDPLLLYLTGGPATSAFISFLHQIGPLSFNYEYPLDNITLELNPYSWTKIANVIYVDLPAGCGYAYAETWEATQNSDTLLVVQIYDFITKWFADHPRFLSNPFYVSGISYMGILIPIIVSEIYDSNERGVQQQLNIKGYLIISPLTDKFFDFNSRIEFAHRTALISDEIYESVKENCGGNYIYVDSSNSLCLNSLQRVDECTSQINLNQILEPICDPENEAETCQLEAKYEYSTVWANEKAVQKALNVREGTIETWSIRNNSIHYDLKKPDNIYYSYDIFSCFDYHKKLLSKNCRAFIINGDHDMTFPYVGDEKWIKGLNLEIESPWGPWFVNNQVAGYQTTFSRDKYSLKHATVKGSGHSVALYYPKELFVAVDRWLASPAHSSL